MKIAGALKSEPDGITDRLTYGPRVLVSLATLDKTGLIKPGTLVRWRYAVKTGDADGEPTASSGSLRERIEAGAAGGGLHRSPTGAIPRRR